MAKKQKSAPPEPAIAAGNTEWEQTLVAAESPTPEPLPELEPLAEAPPEPAFEPVPETPLELLEPGAPSIPSEPEPTLDSLQDEERLDDAILAAIPEDLRKYVRRDGSRIILREPFLPLAKRQALERVLSKKGIGLSEHRWIPSKRESLRDVEVSVDALAWRPRYQPKAVAWLDRQAARKRRTVEALERIPANIIEKRVVYETEGGFVVEVAYRELGQRRKKYFVVPAKGNATTTLRAVRSGTYAQATAVTPELIEVIGRSHRSGAKATPPGKIKTWPIRNKYALATIPGVNRPVAKSMETLGIRTTDQLRVHSHVVVARHVGVVETTARKWQHEAEFLLLSRMDPRHAHLLAEAGFEGLKGLQDADAEDVATRVNALVARAKGRNKPWRIKKARAAAWIRQARKMRQTVQQFPA